MSSVTRRAMVPSCKLRSACPAVVLVLVQVPLGDEDEGADQVVLGFASLLHLIQILLREEAVVGDRRFIDRAKLVDAQLRADSAQASAFAAILRRTGEGHQANHSLRCAVAQLHLVQRWRGVLPEQAAVQGPQAEAVAVGRGAPVRHVRASRAPPCRNANWRTASQPPP